MLEQLQAALAALDELALALENPEAIRRAQATNRELAIWYIGMMQRVSLVQPIANGKAKTPASSGS